ncbi:putative membrane protein [Maritalea mobilis]|uniref:Putative membrane protein n=1 Tax=Maritalea mobilis TaxID=483324 RepID=A0A4V3DBL0_9HYPH|nr:DUF2269 domain-containing protein [Maritalea mobilis]TDQ66988.1 putative membrane protein [Maritalea mobilis]
MIEYLDVLRWLHILGATVLFGTGAGIAFFMLMAHRTGNAEIIAHTASVVVIADWVFTASAVVLQPITGYLLAAEIGWSIGEGWVVAALALYVITGLFWLPVIWMQKEMRDLARAAHANGLLLSKRYHVLFRTWFLFGFPAFFSVLIIFWLMITRPSLGVIF